MITTILVSELEGGRRVRVREDRTTEAEVRVVCGHKARNVGSL